MGQQLLAALAKIRDELDRDPLFRGKRYTVGELEKLLARGPDGDLATLFSDTLQGMTQSARYGAIKVVHAKGSETRVPALAIAKGETRVIAGDLRVDGDLDNAGILVVTGDLVIGGRYIAPTFGYSLGAVGGTMMAQHVTTSGEVLVGKALEAIVVHVIGNDYSVVLPRLQARALVIEDSFPLLGDVSVEARVKGNPTDAQLQAWFGKAPTDDEAEEHGSRVRAAMLAGWEPPAVKKPPAKKRPAKKPKR